MINDYFVTLNALEDERSIDIKEEEGNEDMKCLRGARLTHLVYLDV